MCLLSIKSNFLREIRLHVRCAYERAFTTPIQLIVLNILRRTQVRVSRSINKPEKRHYWNWILFLLGPDGMQASNACFYRSGGWREVSIFYGNLLDALKRRRMFMNSLNFNKARIVAHCIERVKSASLEIHFCLSWLIKEKKNWRGMSTIRIEWRRVEVNSCNRMTPQSQTRDRIMD